MSAERLRMIEERLRGHLPIRRIAVTDDSHHHIGHAGAADGRGHFSVHVVSPAFEGRSLLQRHRLVYEALGDAMETDIHALAIRALTPAEAMDSPAQDPP